MIPRRLLALLSSLALAAFSPGCVAAGWHKATVSYTYQRQRNLVTGRADREQQSLTITVPLFDCSQP